MADVKITDNSTAVKQAMENALMRSLVTMGITAQGYAQMNLNKPMPHADGTSHPYIDTGRTLNDINYAVQGKQVQVGVNVEYAVYLHEGTRYIKPNRFLRDAVADHVDVYKMILENELKRTTL